MDERGPGAMRCSLLLLAGADVDHEFGRQVFEVGTHGGRVGGRREAGDDVVSKIIPPAIGASRASVVIASMLSPCRASTADTSWTMPGRSLPIRSSVSCGQLR